MKVIIINGPNLNLLGVREKSIYGDISFDQYLSTLRSDFPDINLDYFQSNIEGELINKLHEVGFTYNYILLNGGGYTHTSVAISDALAAIKVPVIEIHMSNIYSREEFRRTSMFSRHCQSIVCGFGIESYKLALFAINPGI